MSKLVTAATLFFGAKLVIDGSLTVGELVAFNMLAGRVSSPVLRLAQMWQDFHQARLSIDRLGDILNTPAEPTYYAGARGASRRSAATSASSMSTFRYRIDGPEILHDVSFDVPNGPGRRHRRLLGLGQEHARQARAAPLRARDRPRARRRS